MTLPYSRVVNVNVSRNSGFPSRRGFGVALFLTSVEVAGVLDASNLTRVYGSIQEVEADFATNSEFYKAATAAFSVNPRPIQIKAGYYDAATVTDAAKLTEAISNIADIDNQWYWLGVEADLRDTAMLDGLVSWTQTQNKFFMPESNDVLTEDVTDTTNFSARHKGTVDRTGVFYHSNVDLYPAFAKMASLGTRVFDDADSAYTGKFKQLPGISPMNIGSAKVQAVTGFTPNLGQSVAAGHCANMYVDIGGTNLTVEGSTLTPNVFIDEIHFTDWLIARTEEEMLALFMKNDRIPYTNVGMELLASVPRQVVGIAQNAGLIADDDVDPVTGEFLPAVTITVPNVLTTTETQRKARIAPAIEIKFRYAGAVHYTTVNYTISF